MISRIKTRLKGLLTRVYNVLPVGGANARGLSTEEVGALLNELRALNLDDNQPAFNETLWANAEAVRKYLHSFLLDNADEAFTCQYVNDALPRFFHTLRFLPPTPDLKVLELGGNPYLFSILVKRFFAYETRYANFFAQNIYETAVDSKSQKIESRLFNETYEFEYQTFNMELSDYPYPDETFDGVLFCEILEHLVINPLRAFERLRKIIRPGGWLLLTTPNAVRLQNVALMLSGNNFFDRYHPEFTVYGRHNREFTVEEVREILGENGFEVLECLTFDRYDYSTPVIIKDSYEKPGRVPYTKPEIEKLLKTAGGSLDHRGDNIYAFARRI